MAQVQASGLRIDTTFSSGQLSLHEYRKYLSQDSTKMSPTPRPRLKRKPAALNLCQRPHHDFGFQLLSPASSAPSSPPPLSFSQSVISLPGGDILTPMTPISMIRPSSRPASSSHLLGARRMDPFSARLKRPTQNFASHSRTSSDSTLPSTSASKLRFKHYGAEFEILNPKTPSLFNFDETSTYRLSNFFKDMMEEESPDVSPTHSFISYALPDDMIRPISASESAVLSKYISPPLSQGLPQSTYSFGALPPLKELPSSPVSPRIPKTPVRTLKQKVSRLFSSSDKRASPRLDIDVDTSYNSRNEKDVPRSPLSNDWDTEDSVKIRHSEMVVDTTSSEYERLDPSHHGSEDPISHRRPNWGPHSSNRHQTLQDALRQLETDNNGLAFEDIVRYLDAENGNMVETGDGNADYGVLDGKVERPWQPDTWNEPTVVRMPHNRPSDSNLSTNAPSTRASIRPYVERAAAFMAGGGGGSSSSSLASDPAERREASKVETINENNYEKDEVEENYEDEEEDRADDRSEPLPSLRRSISRRARPLSSNPPDLDTPLLFESSSSSSSLASHAYGSPEIPARHPDHRIIRFEEGTGINLRVGTPPPPNLAASQAARPTVKTAVTAPKKKSKKHSSGCHCL